MLEGAFTVLDALAALERPAGLSELARAAGLPKSTVHRLMEQLVELEAAQRVGERYVVGALVDRLSLAGRRYPALQAAASTHLRELSALAPSSVSIGALRGDRLVVLEGVGAIATGPTPIRIGEGTLEKTAMGRILLAADPDQDRPAGMGSRQWRHLRLAGRRPETVVIEHEEAHPSVSCVAAPVQLPGGCGYAALGAVVYGRRVRSSLSERVQRAAAIISRSLASTDPREFADLLP